MAKKKIEKVEIGLQNIDVKEMRVQINGVTPLLMDRFSEETEQAILDKQTGITKSAKKKVRNIQKEIEDAVHKTNKGKIGFPVAGFKRGMMEATSFVGDKFFSKKLIAGAVKIVNGVDGLVPIKYKKKDELKHNICGQTKFTPQFHGWSCELRIRFDANNIAPTDIVKTLNYAGFYSGIGSWRPKGRDGGSGEFGCYEVKLK
jgi:hypothetical protein